MSAGFWLVCLLVSACGVLVWLALQASYRNGRMQARHESDVEQRKTVMQAAHVRDRLLRDPAFARSVRERFTR